MSTTYNKPVQSISHGYPSIKVIRRSIKELYRRLPGEAVWSFPISITPAQIAPPLGNDPYIGVQHVAAAFVRHLRLPEARIIVGFTDMDIPGRVELTSGREYFVELNSRYKDERYDIPAVLAHEVTHVFLHRSGIRFPDIRDNEILTDVAALYLGIGWPFLNAYRATYRQFGSSVVTSVVKLGYLTPEELGYVLGKRIIAFGDNVDRLVVSPVARQVLWQGLALARLDHQRPPLQDCRLRDRFRYFQHRSSARRRLPHKPSRAPLVYDHYEFESDNSLRVIFECPICHQKIRLPVSGKMTARCVICRASLLCHT